MPNHKYTEKFNFKFLKYGFKMHYISVRGAIKVGGGFLDGRIITYKSFLERIFLALFPSLPDEVEIL